MGSNSPNFNSSSSLRNLPQSYHFNPRMGSPGSNLSPYNSQRVNSESPNFISINSSSPADNRKQPFRHFNNSPRGNRQRFSSNRRNFSTPNTSFNSSRNSSFNSSFNSSQNYSPRSQKSSYDSADDFENSASYHSMFGNPWAELENNLKQKFGDRLEPLPNIAVHRKNDKQS